MKEQDSSDVFLHDVDDTAMKFLLEYAYTGEIVITSDNVQVLLPASSLMQIQEVRDACCRFLMKQLHPTNCLGIRSFADTHSCKELHLKSHCFALQNFQQVVATEEFLLLPFNEVELDQHKLSQFAKSRENNPMMFPHLLCRSKN